MTYNFDPDRWFDNEMAALDARRARDRLSDEEYKDENERIVNEYEKMLDRLEMQADYSSGKGEA